jgi:pantoate--beta-alanine ligase
LRVIKTSIQLKVFVEELKLKNVKIGFVPTMGALHSGHLSLINFAKKECNFTIASIFVNPTQFNNSADLEKYPRPLTNDLDLLEQVGCDAVFVPDVPDMYPEHNLPWTYEVGYLDTILEGSFRSGHYLGVTQIVYKLFELVKPDLAYFGQKDYQQFLVIKKLVKDFNLPINIVACPIIREDSGLALSSRNIRLNTTELKKSLVIYRSLMFLKDNFVEDNADSLIKEAQNLYKNIDGVTLEYIEIREQETLKPYQNNGKAIALVACKVGETRLIDNMMLS